MYKYGRRERTKHHFGYYFVGVLLLLGIAGSAYAYWDAGRNSKITKASTAVLSSEVTDATKTDVKKVDEPYFTLNIPKTYKEIERTNSPVRKITWQDTNKKTTARSLTLYIDTIPTNLAVNRLMPVSASGPQLTPMDASDNCASFVGPINMTPAQASAAKPTPGKWQGVNFICDLPNYLREVAGTGSTEGVNVVTVTGPTSGKHAYFFAYTDHTVQPDFSIFRTIVSSFRAK